MKILAIETSCDDTGVAVLEADNTGFKVLSNVVASQIKVHQKYGGVFPAMAKREHQKNLVPAFITALEESGLLVKKEKKEKLVNAKLKEILEREPELYKKIVPLFEKYEKPDVDFISIVNGPGLEPCLWVGVNFARALSYFWGIDLVPVNHIEGHILVNFLENTKIEFPVLALVVSGGHTQLVLAQNIGQYKILGETRDDAAGECFDKCAKILGLNYPGGPEIAKQAEGIKPKNIFPRPMIGTHDYDFSFSGLKTAVLYHHKKQDKKTQKSKDYIKQMAAETQQAIIDVLLKKTLKAAQDYNEGKIPMTKSSRIHDGKAIGTIILGGGSSANEELRKQFEKATSQHLNDVEALNLVFPPVNLSTDNALMSAITGYIHQNKKTAWQNLKANANLRIGA